MKQLSGNRVSIDSHKHYGVSKESAKKHRRKVHFLLALSLFNATTSGIALHIAGHGTDHEIWHGCAVAHVILSALFVLCSALHIRHYFGIYKPMKRMRIAIRNIDIVIVSFLLPTATITGIVLLAYTCAPNTGLSLWHYWLGMLMAAFTTIHIIRRKCR